MEEGTAEFASQTGDVFRLILPEHRHPGEFGVGVQLQVGGMSPVVAFVEAAFAGEVERTVRRHESTAAAEFAVLIGSGTDEKIDLV